MKTAVAAAMEKEAENFNIAAAVEAGAALIVCNGFLMAEATQQGVDQYPDQAFALIDSVDAQGPNLLNLTFKK